MNGRIERLKPVASIAVVASAVTLAFLIGDRLTDEAMAALAGAACGIGAAIPAGLLAFALTRHKRSIDTITQPQPRMTTPQVMMIPPMMMPQQQPSPPATWETAPAARHFTVVGEE